jgi:large subunit ribosomal protein L9
MEVILRKDVEKLGLRGDVVNVARGYARNYLLPRGLAEQATPAKVAELQKREAQRARSEAQTFDQARELATLLEGSELRFDVQAGPTGTLFGSVTPTDVVENVKRIGRYTTPIELFTDVEAEVRLVVVPEGGELPPEEELEALEAAERAEAEVAAAQAAETASTVEELVEAEAEPEPEPVAVAEAHADVPEDAFDRAAGAALETPAERADAES